MVFGFRLFDRITPFDTPTELAKGNIAVGIVVGSIFVGIGIAIGLVMGMGLNEPEENRTGQFNQLF